MVRSITIPIEVGMNVLSAEYLQTLSLAAGLNPRFPDGHVALFLALRDEDAALELHQYTLRLDNASTTDTTYSFALRSGDLVWSLGNLRGWEAIEQHETQWGTHVFEEWAGGPATSMVFLKEKVQAHCLPTSPYIQQKTQVLRECIEDLRAAHL